MKEHRWQQPMSGAGRAGEGAGVAGARPGTRRGTPTTTSRRSGPHWKWLIIGYFFLGGIAGASYVVASVAELLGGDGNRRIARAGRYVSFAALLPCPPLLILD